MYPKDQEVVETSKIQSSKPRKNQLGYVAIIVVCVIYILNPSSGIIEILPDIIPLVGNADEAAATAVILWMVKKMRENS
jgi:uncharacterized membrane protein YkvA (DUF1232 family)